MYRKNKKEAFKFNIRMISVTFLQVTLLEVFLELIGESGVILLTKNLAFKERNKAIFDFP